MPLGRLRCFLKALREAGQALGLQDLLRRARVSTKKRGAVERALAELVRQGTVRRDGKRFVLAKHAPRQFAESQTSRGAAAQRRRTTGARGTPPSQ